MLGRVKYRDRIQDDPVDARSLYRCQGCGDEWVSPRYGRDNRPQHVTSCPSCRSSRRPVKVRS